ncbi:carbohydrate kinase family protein [Roseobacter weihaiensis]|uniref:carbohydrate kinase family protein n=1 Tax=Roseobacter weihaiensis TaxID=2763262 RepID=UPI001D0A855B|nr:carbohydrate kinase family protein [Roseobacter sp. H9]
MTDIGPVLVLGAASWNRMIYVADLPQGTSATVFEAHETESAGSTGVGKSMALAALGCKPTLHCALGQDQHAALVRSACEASKITMMVDEQDAPTPHHLNIMDKNGGRYSLFLSNGPADPLIDESRIAPEIEAAQTIFLSLSASSRKILHLLKLTKAEILLDLHDYDGVNPWYDDFIAQADVVQLSDVALREPDLVIGSLLSGRAHQVVLTKAEKGAEIVTARERIAVPALPAKMMDSNGAGDAFSVALWYAQRSGRDLAPAGRFAAAAAAFAIESPMLFPADITVAQIEERAGLR